MTLAGTKILYLSRRLGKFLGPKPNLSHSQKTTNLLQDGLVGDSDDGIFTHPDVIRHLKTKLSIFISQKHPLCFLKTMRARYRNVSEWNPSLHKWQLKTLEATPNVPKLDFSYQILTKFMRSLWYPLFQRPNPQCFAISEATWVLQSSGNQAAIPKHWRWK